MRIHLALIVFLAAVLLAACVEVPPGSGGTPTPIPATPIAPTPTPPHEPVGTPVPEVPPAILAVRAALAAQLGIDEKQLDIVSWEAVQWPDSCLGVNTQEKPCLDVITPGYRVIFATSGRQIEVHTNADGSKFAIAAEQPTPGAGAPWIETVRKELAARLQVAIDAVKLVSAQAVEWPDGCLGAAHEDVACTDAIVPGYRLVFDVNGQTYEIHTAGEGTRWVLAQGPDVALGDVVLNWRGQAGGACALLKVDAAGRTAWGECLGVLFGAPLANGLRQAELGHFLGEYTPFMADGPDGSLEFNGRGARSPEAAESRALGEWAAQVWQEQQIGREGPPAGRALHWSRDGGPANRCDSLDVYRSGVYYKSNCMSMQPGIVPLYLPEASLEQLYAWLDRYAPFQYSQPDPGGAKLSLVFDGTGSTSPSDAEMQEIMQWALALYGG